MNNSFGERNAFSKVLDQIMYLIPLAVFPLICLFLVHASARFTGFWPGTIVVIIATIISLIVGNSKRATDNKSNSEISLRNLLILSAGGAGWVALANRYNDAQNELSPTVLTLATGIGVLVAVLSFHNGFKNRYDKYYYQTYSKALAIGTIISMVVGLYKHFGTQFVWVPALAGFFFSITFLDEPSIDEFLEEKWDASNLVFAFPIIGTVSTLCQFWFTTVLSVPLWHIVVPIGTLGFATGVMIFLRGRQMATAKKERESAEEQRQEAQRKAEAEEQKRKKELADKAREETVQMVMAEISRNTDQHWINLLIPIRHYSNDSRSITALGAARIAATPLSQLVTISKMKRHLVWTDDLITALKFISNAAVRSYNDDTLELFMKQVESFLAFLEPYKDFTGYEGLLKEIKSTCSPILILIENKK